MTRRTLAFASLVFALFLAQGVQAQVSFGPQAIWADETDFGVGARAHIELGDLFGAGEGPLANLLASVTGSFFFPNCGSALTSLDCDYFELSGNMIVPFETGSAFKPYAGAGIYLGRFSADADAGDGLFDVDASASDTEIGLGVVGGGLFKLGGLDAFSEARFNLSGYDQFMLTFGVLFGS